MTYHSFDLTVDNHIAWLTFNRPDAYNALCREFWVEFPEAVRQLDADADARVLVLAGEGKHFCAGMDLQVFTQPQGLPMFGKREAGRKAEAMRRLVLQLQHCFSVLEEIRMPVISAIQGGCIGGAVDMVCATDMRYCTQDGFFTVKETELGMTADLGTMQRLPQLIPQGLARELAYTGRKMLAEEAMRVGFVNRVFDDVDAMNAGVQSIAEQIAAHSPLAISGCKTMMNYARDHSIADSLNLMATWQAGMFQPTDMMLTFGAKQSGTPAEFDPLAEITPPLQPVKK